MPRVQRQWGGVVSARAARWVVGVAVLISLVAAAAGLYLLRGAAYREGFLAGSDGGGVTAYQRAVQTVLQDPHGPVYDAGFEAGVQAAQKVMREPLRQEYEALRNKLRPQNCVDWYTTKDRAQVVICREVPAP